MREKIVFIINPISGTQDKQAIVDYINKNIDYDIFDVSVYYTKCAGDATVKAKEFAESGYDKVVAVGGDGTVNEVGRGLIGTETALGIVPLGSGNGMARHLKIPLNFKKAIDIVLHGNILNADHGMLNGKPFFCTAGTGFDAQVGHRFAIGQRRGFTAYAQAALKEYIKFKPQQYKVTTDKGSFTTQAFMITFANASQWGYNAYVAPDASISDGILDMVVVRPFIFLELPLMGAQMFTRHMYKSANIEVYKIKYAKVERIKDDYIHIDGDSMFEQSTLDVSLAEGNIKMLTPSVKPSLLYWNNGPI